MSTTDPLEWQEDAKCRSGLYDPELWFAEGVTSQAYEDRAYAKAICHRCPVIKECLDYVMRLEPAHKTLRFGVYGGTSANERARLGKEAAA